MNQPATKFSYWDEPEVLGAPDVERVNILVVDDLPEKLMAYETILEELGQNIVTVHSGEEALKLVLREEFAVILLDVNMPGLDGFETASMIRKRKKSSHTPIIFLTAFTDELRMAQGYASGAVDYLPTPVVPEILRAKVKVFIELSQMRRRAAMQAQEHALRTAAEQSARRSDFLVSASETLTRATSEKEVLEALVRLPIPYLADTSLLWMKSGELQSGHLLRATTNGGGIIHGHSDSSTDVSPQLMALFEDLTAQGRPQVLRNVELPDAGLTRLHTVLLLPLTLQQNHAVMLLARSQQPVPYLPADISLAVELAAHGSIALEKTLLMQRIQEADRRKDEFLAMLAHELRNPLAPIRNALETVKRSPDRLLRDQAQKTIERQLEHLIHLVDDLMDVSRITKGKIELRKEPVRLQDALAQAVETAEPLMQQQRHELRMKLPENDIWLHADSSRVSQIFSNLLNNAAKYTNEGGIIEITVRPAVTTVEVSVRDSGIGIPADMLVNVFDLFSQVDSSLERTQGGLGIGLTLVKSLVEMHNGSIVAKSEGLGKGSQFVVTLPVVGAPLVQDNEPIAEKQPTIALKVLVVDDNEASAKTMGWMLELEGHEAKLAHDGITAIELAHAYRPDVVLLDIGLPGMNGYDICKAMRQDPALANTIFIAQTGWGQEEHRRRSKEAGFDHHLVKPVKLASLQQLFQGLTT